MGWPCPSAGRTLHGNAGGDPEESRDSVHLSALVSGGEGEEVSVDGLHTEAPHHSQCDGEAWHAVAGGGQSAGLIFKTVADPILLRSNSTNSGRRQQLFSGSRQYFFPSLTPAHAICKKALLC